jgi:uncharacterized protein (DUF2252 family)
MSIAELFDKRLLAAFKRCDGRSAAGGAAIVKETPAFKMAKDTLDVSKLNRDVVAEVMAFNAPIAEQSPALLHEKFTRMMVDAFAFFRGTDHLFYGDIARMQGKTMAEGPKVLLQGDLHLKNIAALERANGSLTIGPNDFDEAALGPAQLDLERIVASIALVANQLGISPAKTRLILRNFTNTYTDTLGRIAHHKVPLPGQAPKIIRKALSVAAQQDNGNLIASATTMEAGKLIIKRADGNSAVSAELELELRKAFERYRASLSGSAATELANFRFADAVSCVAGVGSVGRARYRLLIEDARGGHPRILEMKEEAPSALSQYLPIGFPVKQEADRALVTSEAFEPGSKLYNGAVELPRQHALTSTSFIVRNVPATKGGVDLATLKDAGQLDDLVGYYAKKIAVGHAAGEKFGFASAQQILASLPADIDKYMATFGVDYGAQVQRDYSKFKAAFDEHQLSAAQK